MDRSLEGKNVAILVTHGFEHSELVEPKRALDEAGARTQVISPESELVRGWKDKNWSEPVHVDQTLDDADAEEFDALILPGGVMNPDHLRINEQAVAFIRSFCESGKPIAAICHGPWPLIEAGGVRGRRMTSYPSLKWDLINAGAEWVDEEVVVDQGLVTSRTPKDLPAFIAKMKEEIAEGIHSGRREETAGSPVHR